MTAVADHPHDGENLPSIFEELYENLDYCDDSSNLPQMQQLFLDYLDRKKRFNVLKNVDTLQYLSVPAPIRGNKSYARRKLKSLLPIFDFIKNGYKFTQNVKGRRTGSVVRTNALLITLTFNHKKYTPSDAWLSLKGVNSIINQFKAGLRKKFGSYSAVVVKEGTESSYPAPHIILLLDKPILAHKVRDSWYLGDNFKRDLLDDLQNIWCRLSGSFLKANAIVDSWGFTYAFKYITKGVNPHAFQFKDTKKSDFTCINTHMFHKLFDLNDIISKKFLETLGYVKKMNILDKLHSKLKLEKSSLSAVVSQIQAVGGFSPLALSLYPRLFSDFRDLIRGVADIQQCIVAEKRNFTPWVFQRAGFLSELKAKQYIEFQQRFDSKSAADPRSVATTVPQALVLVQLAQSIHI